MGLEFQTVPSDFEEYFDESRSVEEIVEELGLGKALEVSKRYPEAIVIGGDTIVVLDGKQLGKPVNAQEAKQMIKAYSNRKHQVITSVAVVCNSKKYQNVSSDIARIEFDELDDDFINKYVETGTVFDKAGAYAIQHPLVKPHVKKINGRIDTIVGLPTNLVSKFLAELGVESKSLKLSDEFLLKDKGFFE